MKTLKLILSLLLIGLLCGTSCEKYKEKVWTELPPETQVGANTIGCLVDGKLWATSQLPGYTLAPAMSSYYRIERSDSIVLVFYANGRSGSMSGNIINPQIGLNIINRIGCSFPSQVNCDRFHGFENGHIFLTKLDIDAGIVSGTFEFRAQCDEDDNILIDVTKGRFDMRMRVYK